MIQVLKSQLYVDRLSQSVQYTFLDYLAAGFELNFMVAVDFTGTSHANTRVSKFNSSTIVLVQKLTWFFKLFYNKKCFLCLFYWVKL